MRTRVILIAVGALAVLVIGTCLVLAFWDFRVPSTAVEKVLPDARFPK